MLQLIGPAGVAFLIFGISRANFCKFRGVVPAAVGWLFLVAAVLAASPGMTIVEIGIRIFAVSVVSLGGWYIAAKFRASV